MKPITCLEMSGDTECHNLATVYIADCLTIPFDEAPRYPVCSRCAQFYADELVYKSATGNERPER